jgi:hypothetical protein
MRQIVFAAVAAVVIGVSGQALALNPQPEPPGRRIALNPQPLPPRRHADFNPQPDPPGRHHHTVTRRLPPGPCHAANIGSAGGGAGAGKRLAACR